MKRGISTAGSTVSPDVLRFCQLIKGKNAPNKNTSVPFLNVGEKDKLNIIGGFVTTAENVQNPRDMARTVTTGLEQRLIPQIVSDSKIQAQITPVVDALEQALARTTKVQLSELAPPPLTSARWQTRTPIK